MQNMKKILIADDQKEIRELIEVSLRKKGFHIIQVKNAKEAVDSVKKEKPDLVIMDIMMPGKIDGLDATRTLKSDPQTQDVKIIILTVKGQNADKEKGLKAGADEYCTKPFKPQEILNLVKKILEE